MPKVKVNRDVMVSYTLTIELSPDELDRLKAMMQNPIITRDGIGEPPMEHEIRRAIFDACNQHRT